MAKNRREFRGLCMSCRNADDCTVPRMPDTPALYCEQFEIDNGSAVKTLSWSLAWSPASDAGRDEPGFVGLCRNCEIQQNCSYPKPDGGIWYCEEYR